MSEKVRSLDIEQSNMRSAAQILDDIQDLKTCLYRAEEDIAAGEIEAACVHVKKYLTYTNVSDIETIYNETHVLADINPMSPIEDTAGLLGPSPITALKAVHKKLTTILLDAFDASVASNSTNEMIRIFKLFPEISQGNTYFAEFRLSWARPILCVRLQYGFKPLQGGSKDGSRETT